jgi:hypothetical protein
MRFQRGVAALAVATCAVAAGCGGSSDDKKASTTTASTAAAAAALPTDLQGTWTRKVTQKDIDRTADHRNEAGPNQDAPKPGPAQLVIQPGDMQTTDQNAQFTVDQDFKATNDGKLAILGYQHPERGAFCSPSIPQNADYTWKVSGGELVLDATADPCADRDSTLTGTWKRG